MSNRRLVRLASRRIAESRRRLRTTALVNFRPVALSSALPRSQAARVKISER
ncbi:MAG: hypothetical protein M3R55_14870 [Acidobacteriota bacterium]|nr:hypothetical protein [Acidobacteriota bacterium]